MGFRDFVLEEEDFSCVPILARIKIHFTLIIVEKNRRHKMYIKTLTYLISRIRNLILAVKDQNIILFSIHMCFDNVAKKQSAPS